MPEPAKKLLVATDLDATLLDHQTYSYAPALPAINLLKARECPIVFNSSKTQAEQMLLREDLGIAGPFIIENGAAVVIPPGQLDLPKTEPTAEVKIFGPPYAELIARIHQLRQTRGYRFRGFADLSAAEVAEITGLSPAGAAAAKQRAGSEPLCWEDSEAAYEDFTEALAELGLQTTQGGRFRHVTAAVSKGKALAWLVDRYRAAFPQVEWLVVALGDSPNDVPMLQVADVGVLIPNPHRAAFEVTGVPRLLKASESGPAGWGAAIATLINQHLEAV